MRILLANVVTPTIPMGLFAIADALERAGHSVRIFHREIERAVDPSFSLGHVAARDGAGLVGIAIHWSHQSLAAVELAAEVKRAAPGAFVVAGGLTASSFPAEIVETVPAFDAVIRGEGEGPLVALARELELAAAASRAPDLAAVPNLAFRGANGAAVLTPLTYVARGETLGELRFARGDLLGRRLDYMALDLFPGRLRAPVFLLCTGRGCTVNCTACGGGRKSHAEIAGRDRANFRPVDAVVRDLRTAADQGYRSFYVCNDPKPNGPYFFELFEALKAAGLAERLDLGFGCWGLPSRAFLEAARATFATVFLEISPETGSEALRKQIRGFWYTNAELEEALAAADALELTAEVYFGFPNAGETEEDLRATRAYALSLARRHTTRIGVNVLALSTDPMSPLARESDRLGIELRARTFGGYVEALRADRATYPPAGRPPWLQNYLFHRPVAVSPRAVAIAGLATATEAALRARRPGLLFAAVDSLGGERAFEAFLERALGPLLDALEAERDRAGHLDVDDAEVARLGVRRLCAALLEAPAAAGVPGLTDLAREAAAREDLLSRLHAPGGERRDAAGPALPPAWFRGTSPSSAARGPVAARLGGAGFVPPSPRRREVATVTLARLPGAAAPEPAPVRLLLTVDPDGREWGIELSSDVERALALCDGRSWSDVARALGGIGAGDAEALLGELLTYGAIA